MNWLFGKRKPPSIEVYVSEETPEGFESIRPQKPSYESPLPPYPPLPRGDSFVAPYPPQASPYPPQASPYPPVPSRYPPVPSPYPPSINNPNVPSSRTNGSHQVSMNPLDSIPFILAPALVTARAPRITNFESLKKQLDQLKVQLDANYDYDFSLERSVLQEHP